MKRYLLLAGGCFATGFVTAYVVEVLLTMPKESWYRDAR